MAKATSNAAATTATATQKPADKQAPKNGQPDASKAQPDEAAEVKTYLEMSPEELEGIPETTSSDAGASKPIEEGHESLLEKFFIAQLKDIYYAEKKILQGLAEMESAATTDELKEAFYDHSLQTSKQVKRLEKVFKTIGVKAEGEKCEAIEGLLKEAKSIISETKEGTMTRDAALIMAAQKVEHYEIATYGGLVQLALTLGQHEAADLLEQSLEEEEDTDLALTDIAETSINIEAEEEEKFSSRRKQKS